MLLSAFALLFLAATPALAQSPLWGQCGGVGWSGSTTCVSGATCVKQNDYYYQCVPGAGSSSNPPSTPTTNPQPTTTRTFRNPLKTPNGSDPQIVYWSGYYYLTTTTWTNIQITRATTIGGLKTATPVVVWSDTNPARCCNVWAPEIHRINGRWYIYYTAGPSGSSYTETQKTWVLQGGTDNPLQTYTFLGQPIAPNNNIPNLDSTVYTIGSKNYYIYSAWTAQGQSLFIAELLTPATIGPSTRISTPTLSWETVKWGVNEGPYGLTSPTGRVFVFYSASSCDTASYALGYLELKQGANPLLASSWVKNPNVQFSSANGAYGPGHHGFFKSPSGQDYIVYHANSDAAAGCGGSRSTRVQRISWNSDGTPNLGTPVGLNVDVPEPV